MTEATAGTTTGTTTGAGGTDTYRPTSGSGTAKRAISAPANVVAGLLPTSPVPVILGAGALAVAGVVDWPVAGAIGLGYLALRRWR